MDDSGWWKTSVKPRGKQIKAGDGRGTAGRARQARRGRVSPRANKEGRMDGEQGRKGARAGGAALRRGGTTEQRGSTGGGNEGGIDGEGQEVGAELEDEERERGKMRRERGEDKERERRMSRGRGRMAGWLKRRVNREVNGDGGQMSGGYQNLCQQLCPSSGPSCE